MKPLILQDVTDQPYVEEFPVFKIKGLLTDALAFSLSEWFTPTDKVFLQRKKGKLARKCVHLTS